MIVNDNFTGGTIKKDPYPALPFEIDKNTKTITVTDISHPGESVVFIIQETAE